MALKVQFNNDNKTDIKAIEYLKYISDCINADNNKDCIKRLIFEKYKKVSK